MAIFHFSVKVISRSAGRSSVAAAAYRAAEQLHDERLGRSHDFSNKAGVVHSEILLPEHAPQEFADRSTLWNAVEASERRKDAQLAREVEFVIPREMTQGQGIDLARDFVAREFVAHGMIADLNVHWDIGEDGLAKPHAHVMLTMREVVGRGGDEEIFGTKVRDWNRTELLEQWRERWADNVNQRLAELDIDARVDHRSLEDQGIDLEPQDKVGPAAQRRGESGLESERIDDHRDVARRNGERIIKDPSKALDAITHYQATFTHRDLAMFIHRHSDGKAQFDTAVAAVRASPDLVALGRDGRGSERFTSRDMIETEHRMERAANRLAERKGHGMLDSDLKAAVAIQADQGLELSCEQHAALENVTGDRGLSIVIGYAGSGKSALLDLAREAWERGGVSVRGAALSGIAAEGLENGSGIASRTIASLEHGWLRGSDMLGAGDVLVIDEAGMVGTRQMERVLSHAAEAGAKVVLIGDPQQLQAIEAGAAFRAIHERHGGVEITQVRRQREAWQRDATRHLATGRTGEAIHAYVETGMVHVADTREAARVQLIERWDSERQLAPGQSRVILTHTNDEVRELNEAARGRMRDAGELGEDVRVKTARGERSFAPGDRLMFLLNDRGLGVKNGTPGMIAQISQRDMVVRTDDGRFVTFDLNNYAHLDHGYAATIHKAQGQTVDRAHVLATPGMDSHSAYVALSRHRNSLDLHYGRDDFADENRLIRILGRERFKEMATDYRPAREFAERRGLSFPESIAEILQKVPGKARDIFANFRPTNTARRAATDGQDVPWSLGRQPGLTDNLPRAAQRYARAVEAIHMSRGLGIEAMPHQRVALERAAQALDAIRPHASTDLGTAFERNPEFAREAAGGISRNALRAMAQEENIRTEPLLRADRFIEGWQQLQRDRDELVRDGNFRGARQAAREMHRAAKSLERDEAVAALLFGRAAELGLPRENETGRGLARDLIASIPKEVEQDRSRGLDRGR